MMNIVGFELDQDVDGVVDRGGEDLADVDVAADVEPRRPERDSREMSRHLLQVCFHIRTQQVRVPRKHDLQMFRPTHLGVMGCNRTGFIRKHTLEFLHKADRNY